MIENERRKKKNRKNMSPKNGSSNQLVNSTKSITVGGDHGNQKNDEGSTGENYYNKEPGSLCSGMITNQDHASLMSISCKTSNLVRDDQVGS